MPTFPDIRQDQAAKADPVAVTYLQQALLSQGYYVPVNGWYDSMTIGAVHDFQATHLGINGQHLAVDGWVGKNTWWAIQNPSGGAQKSDFETMLRKGLSADRRALLRTALKDHAANTREIPDGSNYGDGVTRYLTGIGPAYWCFTGDQEILTQEHGWVRLDKLNVDHGAVAQVNDKLEITFACPSAYIKKFHQGEIISSVQKIGPQFSCDSEHRFFGFQGSVQKALTKPQFRTVGTITQDFQIPAGRKKNSEVEVTTDDMELLGAFLADGTRESGESIEFLVQRDRKIQRLRRGFGTHQPREREDKAEDGDKRICFSFNRPEFFSMAFTDYKTLNHSFVSALSSEQAEACLRGFQAFDGTQCMENGIWVHTSREHHADLLLTLCVLAGFHPKYGARTQPENSFSTGSTLHWVRMHRSRKTLTLQGTDLVRTNQKVMLYCVTVPEGRIIVRGGNKIPFITGNCCAAVSTWYKDVTSTWPFNKRYLSVADIWQKAKTTGNAVLISTKPVPCPGDAFVFQYRNSKGDFTGMGHIGLVATVSQDGESFNTVEGNAGNRVKVSLRDVHNPVLVGFIDFFGDRAAVLPKVERGLYSQAERADSTAGGTR